MRSVIIALLCLIHITQQDRPEKFWRPTLTCYYCTSTFVGDECWTVTHLTGRLSITCSGLNTSRHYCVRYRDLKTNQITRCFAYVEIKAHTMGDPCQIVKTDKGRYTDCIWCSTPLCNTGPYYDRDGPCLYNKEPAEEEEKIAFWANAKSVWKDVRFIVSDLVKRMGRKWAALWRE
jgi:hypothetical protein